MTSKFQALRRRYENIKATIAGTLIGKLATLSAEQRAEYEIWRALLLAYHADRPGELAYSQMINGGEMPPPSARAIRERLHGVEVTIPADASEAEAAEIYRRFAFGD